MKINYPLLFSVALGSVITTGSWQRVESVRILDGLKLGEVVPQSPSMVMPKTADTPQLEGENLVDIQDINPEIILDIRYATANNFLKVQLYSVPRCLLRTSVAQKLSLVQEQLQAMGLGLKVFDCYRPLSVTRKMWEVLPDPRYVANPARGSRHNRGAAIDLTLIDARGNELEMPTDFDDFSDRAARDYQGSDVSPQARQNSQLLERVMTQQGFIPLITEWWHFDAENWQDYPLLDISLEEINAG
ncbi:M15 family metallopeptidase [Laspinema olomoucense]|uniref:M15 family metallopeptidase n=1 Tax=Laspinema olomoucense TaxID=3231600 RepID=UPI0021BBA369|nr:MULTISPECIES: M15 family metallopeptidase [unclassified Laspinema]MCT7971014.1 M15 family metallopeptidase [Laspinema sp. D3d]MCT7991905.1 M15 family metallopeptidase [Laspinema sp. D3a]